jgi:hypothetical protein
VQDDYRLVGQEEGEAEGGTELGLDPVEGRGDGQAPLFLRDTKAPAGADLYRELTGTVAQHPLCAAAWAYRLRPYLLARFRLDFRHFETRLDERLSARPAQAGPDRTDQPDAVAPRPGIRLGRAQ